MSARLDEIFPRRTAEDLLAKTLAEQQLHTAALNKLGDAIDKFTSGGADKVGEVFTQKVGSQMDNFSAALNKFTEAIDKKLIDALNSHAKQTETSAANFNKAVDSQRQLLTEVTNNNVKQLNDAVNANRDILEQMRQMLQSSADFLRAVDASGTALNQSASTLNKAESQLLTKLPKLAAQMNKLLDANQFTRENLNDLSTQVTTLVKNFNGLADEIERTVKTLRDALEHYNSVTNDGLQEKLDRFDKSMSAAVGYLNELAEDLLEAKLQLGI